MRQEEKKSPRTAEVAGGNARSTRRALRRTLALVAILFVITEGPSFALNPTSHISQYGHTAWRIQDGALPASPTAFAQTPDGYLWVGTRSGLYRFDGVRFTAWNPPAGQQYPSGNASIQSLYVAKDGSLWIGSASGLSHLANGVFTTISAPRAQVEAIAEDRSGAIWITRSHMGSFTGPFCRVWGGDEHCYGESDGIRALGAAAIATDAQGQLWIGGLGSLIQWNGKLVEEHPLPAGKGSGGGLAVAGVVVGADGTVWAGMPRSGPNEGLQQFLNGEWHPYTASAFNGASLSVRALFLDRENCLWVGTADQGIYRIHGKSVDHLGHEDGLSADSTLGIFEDREGTIWVATNEGIDQFRDLPVLTYSNSKGFGLQDLESVLARSDGSVSVSTMESLDSLRVSSVAHQKTTPRLPENGASSLLEDHLGNLWIAGVDGGLYEDENGHLRTIVKGAPGGGFISLAEDADHAIWAEYAGAHPRLIRIENFKVKDDFRPPQVPAGYSVIADPHGGVWLSLFNAALMHYQKGEWQRLPLDPLVHKYGQTHGIYNMWIDSDDTLWGATSGGIVGYKNGNLQLLNARNGLPCSVTYSVITDLAGNLWIQSPCALVRIEHTELERSWADPGARLKVSTFTAVDGFRPGIPYGRPAITRDKDGRIWLQNENALMMIDPRNLAGNTLIPPVHVEQLIADHKPFSAQHDLRLPPRPREMEFDYTALSFVVPSRVLFRYMLEGHDTQWQDAGTRRAAFYNDLRPGKYTFRVIASNDSGLWNTQGDSLQFTILPAFYQTNWFYALCGIAFLAFLWLIYLFRLRQLQQEFNVGLEARVNERTRIARELHDTLLQSFNALVVRLQTVSNVLPVQPEEAKRRIDRAIEQASNAVTEGRDKVHELRSGGSGATDLDQSLSDYAKELLSGSTLEPLPTVHVRVEGTPQPLNPVVRDEAYRIAAEGLRNAIRHASARRIEVEIRYDERQLRLRIRDDGSGIDPAVLESEHKAGHWGLRGMRERAKLVGGTLELWSQVDTGTEVELNIPAASAYLRSPSNIWSVFFRFRRVS